MPIQNFIFYVIYICIRHPRDMQEHDGIELLTKDLGAQDVEKKEGVVDYVKVVKLCN